MSDTACARLFGALAAALDAASLPWLVMRNHETLPAAVDNDVDLLVAPAAAEDLPSLVERLAARIGWVVLRLRQQQDHDAWWLREVATGEVLHLDAFYSYCWKGLRYFEADPLLANRQRRRGFWIHETADENAALLIKDLLQNGAVRAKYHARLQGQATDRAERLQARLAAAVGAELARQVVQGAAAGDWAGLERLAWPARTALVRRAAGRNPWQAARGVVGFAGHHLRNLRQGKNGLFVVLVGPDGSGKTTLARSLREQLSPLFAAQRYYHGQFGILPRAGRLRAALGRGEEVDVSASGVAEPDPDRVPPPPAEPEAEPPPYALPRALAYVSYYGLDYLLGHVVVARARARGDLIVFDRYFYDYQIQPSFRALPRGALRWVQRLLPRPDRIVYLHSDPQAIEARKPELTAANIRAQQVRIERLLEHTPGGRKFSSDRGPERMARDVTLDLMALLGDRQDPKGR